MFLLMALLGCPSKKPEARRKRAPVPTAAQSASGIDEESPWPEGFEDLRRSLERFEGVETCRKQLQRRMPVEIAETMHDLGFDQVIRDACASLHALHARDAGLCDRLSVSALRRGCRTRLALLSQDPQSCPEARTLKGRDPLCLAWALREPALCQAVEVQERALCTALLARDPKRCGPPKGAGLRCRQGLQRLGSLVEERVETQGEPPPSELSLDAERQLPEQKPGPTRSHRLEIQGVVLEAEGCGYRVEVGDPQSVTEGSALPPRARVTLLLHLPREARTPFDLPVASGSAEIFAVFPDGERGVPLPRGEGRVRILQMSTERKGKLEAEFQGTLGATPGRLRIRGRFSTYVRDVEALPKRCAKPSP